MADDVTLNAGAGGDTIAADDVAGVKYQRVKIAAGADGAAADTGTTTTPFAVKISDGTDVALVSAGGALLTDASATTQPVSIAATVTVDLAGNNDVTVTGTVDLGATD